MAERAHFSIEGQIRTIKIEFERNFKGQKRGPAHKLCPWLVRHTAWVLNRFQPKFDGKTSYERQTGKKYKSEILQFGETRMFQEEIGTIGKMENRWSRGVWIGKMSTC